MLTVTRIEDSYIAKLSIDMKPTVIAAGFTWDEVAKRWTGSAKHAYRLIKYTDAATSRAIELELGVFDLFTWKNIHASIMYPTSRVKPFDHQLEGAQWALSRRSSYIAFDPGLGKTAIVPLCLNTEDGKTLIICPSFLKLNWEDELENWLIDFHHIQVFRTAKDVVNPNADIYIVPDSLLHVHEFREQFMQFKFKYLVVDEGQRYKSGDARRTMSLCGRREVKLGKGKSTRWVSWKGFHKIAEHNIVLSGTPMPNGRPLELYPLISRFAPHATNYLDPHRYGVRYCAGFEAEWGWDYTGASNLDELNEILTRNYMIVKKKRDCLDMPKKLPPKVIYIEDERSEYLAEGEMKLMKTLRISELITLQSQKDEAFRQRVEDMLEDRPELGGFAFLSELRKLVGLSKVPQALRVIEQLLEDREKIVVFAWHQEVIDFLAAHLADYGVVVITGKVNPDKRHSLVKTFQNGKPRIALLNIQAGGVGITLTKSSLVVFVERSFVPADNDQAFDRIDRIGQDEDVQEISLVVKNSLDHLLMNAHINKNYNINATIKSR